MRSFYWKYFLSSVFHFRLDSSREIERVKKWGNFQVNLLSNWVLICDKAFTGTFFLLKNFISVWKRKSKCCHYNLIFSQESNFTTHMFQEHFSQKFYPREKKNKKKKSLLNFLITLMIKAIYTITYPMVFHGNFFSFSPNGKLVPALLQISSIDSFIWWYKHWITINRWNTTMMNATRMATETLIWKWKTILIYILYVLHIYIIYPDKLALSVMMIIGITMAS